MEKIVRTNMPSSIPAVSSTPQISNKTKTWLAYFIIGAVVVISGVGSGFVLSNKTAASGYPKVASNSNLMTQVDPNKKNEEMGLSDESTFRDSAEGVLVEGGIDGEGTHHLERAGGVSQNVYLNSTVIDLASFKGKKVQVWGETVSGKKAGWLMDVGKIKVIE